MMKSMTTLLSTQVEMKKTSSPAQRRKTLRRSLTLVEIMVVLSLIVLLASIWSFFPKTVGRTDNLSFFQNFLIQSKNASLMQKSDVELIFYLKDPEKGLWRVERRLPLKPSALHFFKEEVRSGLLPHSLPSPFRLQAKSKNSQTSHNQKWISDFIEIEGVKSFAVNSDGGSAHSASISWIAIHEPSGKRSEAIYRLLIHYQLDSLVPQMQMEPVNNMSK